jgi:soluble P-type ATPase
MIRKMTDINEDTGEIVKVTDFKYTIFDDTKGYLFRAKNNYRKSYNDIKLSSIVTNMDDFAKVHKLAEYIYKDTNTIFIRINSRRVRVADIEDIANILNICVRRAKEFISRIKKLHVIAERVDTVGDMVSTKFVFNPLYFSSKKYISSELYFLFQESLNKHLPTWVIRKFHEVGNLSKDK